MKQSIKILVFTGYYLPGYKGGGPIRTIKNLIDQTSDSFSYRVVTLDRDLGDIYPYNNLKFDSWNRIGNSEVFYIQPGLIGMRKIFKLLAKENYDLVYINSFFSPQFSLFPLLLSKALKRPVILGPRGELSEGALKLKSTKKRIFIKVYQLFGLDHGVVFQASTKYEAKDIERVLGDNVNIVIAEDIGSKDFVTNIPVRNKTTKAIFVSRISPMKNLALALKVLEKVESSLVYDIYGPIEDEIYWKQCQEIIANLPPNICVRYRGEIKPENVISVLSKYDLFFMPTRGENYGHVIAEALCAGLPLIISDRTPWKNLQSLGIGWDLPLDNLNAFSTAIDMLAKMPVDDHMNMRKTVLAWARQKFSQCDAIEANIAMFRYAYNKKKGINDAF